MSWIETFVAISMPGIAAAFILGYSVLKAVGRINRIHDYALVGYYRIREMHKWVGKEPSTRACTRLIPRRKKGRY